MSDHVPSSTLSPPPHTRVPSPAAPLTLNGAEAGLGVPEALRSDDVQPVTQLDGDQAGIDDTPCYATWCTGQAFGEAAFVHSMLTQLPLVLQQSPC